MITDKFDSSIVLKAISTFAETSRAWDELRTLPSDVAWVLGDIISGRW